MKKVLKQMYATESIMELKKSETYSTTYMGAFISYDTFVLMHHNTFAHLAETVFQHLNETYKK